MTQRTCRQCGEAGHNVRTCPQAEPRPSRAAKIVRVIPNLETLQTRVDKMRATLDGSTNDRQYADCPHYQDNQGLCHQCGIVMDHALAKAEGVSYA